MLNINVKKQLDSVEGKNCSVIGGRLNVNDWEFAIHDEAQSELVITFRGVEGKLYIEFRSPPAYRLPEYLEGFPPRFHMKRKRSLMRRWRKHNENHE